jgi:hypothetical protein
MKPIPISVRQGLRAGGDSMQTYASQLFILVCIQQ